MAGGSVSDVNPGSAQTLELAQPEERPDALEVESLAPPPEPQAAVRSAYMAHLSRADGGSGGAHDLPAASMIKAIYVERMVAEAVPRDVSPTPAKRAAAVSPKRKAPEKKAKASATARRRKAKAVASSGKRRGKRR